VVSFSTVARLETADTAPRGPSASILSAWSKSAWGRLANRPQIARVWDAWDRPALGAAAIVRPRAPTIRHVAPMARARLTVQPVRFAVCCVKLTRTADVPITAAFPGLMGEKSVKRLRLDLRRSGTRARTLRTVPFMVDSASEFRLLPVATVRGRAPRIRIATQNRIVLKASVTQMVAAVRATWRSTSTSTIALSVCLWADRVAAWLAMNVAMGETAVAAIMACVLAIPEATARSAAVPVRERAVQIRFVTRSQVSLNV